MSTLCNCCNAGLTEDLYCLDCEVKLYQDSIDEWMKKPKQERDTDIARIRQEILGYNLMAEAWREDDIDI
jgi:hypothetical protein